MRLLTQRGWRMWVVDIATLTLASAQFIRIVEEPLSQPISWYGSYLLFASVGLVLSSRMLKADEGTYDPQQVLKLKQARWIYRNWVIIMVFLSSMIVALKHTSGAPQWNVTENVNATVSVIAIALTFGFAFLTKVSIKDSVVQGLIGLSLKGLPQWWLACHMLANPAASPAALAIVAGLVTIGIRVSLMPSPFRMRTWSRDQWGLAIAEYSNLISWSTVGMVWVWLVLSHQL